MNTSFPSALALPFVFTITSFLVFTQPANAQPAKDPLADRVQRGIARGVDFLLSQQQANGGWETDVRLSESHNGGTSALVVLSLLNAGVPKDKKPQLDKGLQYLRGIDSNKVYVRALQTMVLAEANLPQDRELLRKNVRWLLDARGIKNGKLEGWGYFATNPLSNKNASTTQYAVLALWAAKQAGIDVPRDVWDSIREFYTRSQAKEGFWIYDPVLQAPDHDKPSITMTTAGLSGLFIAGMERNAGREKMQKDGPALQCGVYDENEPAAVGLRWLAKNFAIAPEGKVFYHLYGLERAGRLSGLRFIGAHDWYREGSEYLTRIQQTDGHWELRDGWDRWPTVSTSFALLFLSKGRTPVLVSKLVHGNWPRQELDLDWNNDRNDLKHLVQFASKELYKGLPLAWQTFDMMYAVNADGGATDERRGEVVSDLLQSPILYINGHQSPRLRFTDEEKGLIKRYVENGGFIMAEACCGSAAFDLGFKDLVKDIWGDDAELNYLDGNHPVWSSFFAVTPGDPYKLKGLSLGCKTVLIYSPQDMSCHWESGPPDGKDARTDRAFKLGANILAYATGMQPPRPRLTETVLPSARPDLRTPKRGYFQVGQVSWPGGDWRPAPKAMRNVMEHVRTHAGLDVMLKTEKVSIQSESVIESKFLYMHGRLGAGQTKFPFAADQLEHLRFNLENGGLLFADACCGDEPFDKAFRALMGALFPGKKLEQLPLDDVFFSKELNGEALGDANIKCRRDHKSAPRPMAPFLEGIKGSDGRWMVLYSKYDLGCALEGHQSLGCLGYDPPSAMKIATAAVLYNLRP